jgi:hypothetical protein
MALEQRLAGVLRDGNDAFGLLDRGGEHPLPPGSTLGVKSSA